MLKQAQSWIIARWKEASTQLGLVHITAGLALKAVAAGLAIANTTPGHIGVAMAVIGALQVLLPQGAAND